MSLTKEQIEQWFESRGVARWMHCEVRDMALRAAEPAQPVGEIVILPDEDKTQLFVRYKSDVELKSGDKLYTSPQMPPMSDEEITLLLAKEMAHAASNGLNMQQMALRLCRAVRGER